MSQEKTGDVDCQRPAELGAGGVRKPRFFPISRIVWSCLDKHELAGQLLGLPRGGIVRGNMG